MAEERISRAYIEIVTRKSATLREDARRAGQDAGDASGKQAAKSFDDEFTKESPGRSARSKFLGRSIGRHVGKEAGERASKEMGDRLEREGRFVRAARKIGRRFGRDAGNEASRGFGERFSAAKGFLAGVFSAQGREAGQEFRKTFANELGALKGGGSGVAGLLGGLGKGSAIVGGGAAALSGLGTTIPVVVGAVTQLSGVVGLMPGIYAGAAVATNTLKLGINGVSDAISASDDPKKYAEALKGLAPAARSFVKEIVELKPAAKDLQQSVQQSLFKGLGKEIEPLGKRYLPIVERGLTRVAAGFNAGAREGTEFLGMPWASTKVDQILQNIGEAGEHVGRALGPATGALLSVLDVSTGALPRLTAGLDKSLDKFSRFVWLASADGSFEKWLDNGIDGVKQLWGTVEGLGRVVSGIFSAAGGGGGSGLGVLADVLGMIADQIERPAFQRGLGSFFASIDAAGDSVGDALPAVADALVALEPAISKIVAAGGEALGSMLKSAAQAAEDLAPAADLVADALGVLAPHADLVVAALVAWRAAQAGLAVGAFISNMLTLAKGLRTAAAAQGVLNVALTANPIGVVIAAVAALAVGLYVLWQKSQTAREIMSKAFAGIATAVLTGVEVILRAYKGMTDGVLSTVETVLRALGKIPGNDWADRAANDVHGFKESADRAFDAAIDKTNDWQRAVNRMPKEIKLKGQIEDLRNKIDDAKRRLRDPNLARPERTKIRAEIADLQAKVRTAKQSLGSIKDKQVHVDIVERTFHKDYGSYGSGLGVLKAGGGLISGPGTGTSDSIPARLSNGEFVVKAASVRMPGMLDALQRANAGQVPAFAGGGYVGGLSTGLSDLSAARASKLATTSQVASTVGTPQNIDAAALAEAVADAVEAGIRRGMRGLTVRLDDNTLAGAVIRAGGRI